MAHELSLLKGEFTNTPLLLEASYAEAYFSILNREAPNLSVILDAQRGHRYDGGVFFDKEAGYGVVEIKGAITKVPYKGLCGESGVSHLGIRNAVVDLVQHGAKVVVLEQDSGGGEASHTFETAQFIREYCDDHDVKLISYVLDGSFSASYAYSSASHEVVLNPSASVGSIGVVIHVRDDSKAKEKAGIKDIYVTAGRGKVPFAEDGSISEDFRSELKEEVDELYDEFLAHVSFWRAIDSERLIDLGASSLRGQKAVDFGLADAVMTMDGFSKYIEQLVSNLKEGKGMLFNKGAQPTELAAQLEQYAQLEVSLKQEIEDYQLKLSASAEELSELKAELASFKEQADKEKAEMAMKSRITTLSAIVGDEKATALAATLSALDDTAFDAVAGSLAVGLSSQDEHIEAELGDLGANLKVTPKDWTETYAENLKSQNPDFK